MGCEKMILYVYEGMWDVHHSKENGKLLTWPHLIKYFNISIMPCSFSSFPALNPEFSTPLDRIFSTSIN